jgi:hypothetical protein
MSVEYVGRMQNSISLFLKFFFSNFGRMQNNISLFSKLFKF